MTAPLVAVPHLADLRTAVITGALTAEQRHAVADILMSVGAMAEADIQQGDHGEPMEAARWRIVRDQCLAHIFAAVITAPNPPELHPEDLQQGMAAPPRCRPPDQLLPPQGSADGRAGADQHP